MKPRISSGILTVACCLAMTGAVAVAQTPDVTFKAPVNVTRLPPDITKVQVDCMITSSALPPDPRGATGHAGGFQELPVSGGQVVTTATVVVPIPSLNTSANASAASATYMCRLTGFSQPLNQWGEFSDTQTIPAFRISPTPPNITGTFNW